MYKDKEKGNSAIEIMQEKREKWHRKTKEHNKKRNSKGNDRNNGKTKQ